MFNIPENYKKDVRLELKDFIPKDLKSNDKKRVKDAVTKVSLMYQIDGEEIPSVISNEYHCQVIQIYDMEIRNIKDAAYLASLYQSLIKSLCVIRMHDSRDEIYSLAVKRLNLSEETGIVIEHSILSDKYPVGLPDLNRGRLLKYLDYMQTKNRTNKVSLYKEWFYKTYMLVNERAYVRTEVILEGNHWYDMEKMEYVFLSYFALVNARTKMKKMVSSVERMKLNQEIKAAIQVLDGEKY